MESSRSFDPIGKLIGLRYKSHPWHGIELGKDAPDKVTCFVEMVTSDTVKYEVDKLSGYLKLDRPHKYSNLTPSLYGFLPQTYCDKLVAGLCNEATGRTDIVGDNDPLDVCILTEKDITHGDILVMARPIGGFRMIDKSKADDKIICVLENDALYYAYHDISELSKPIVDRLKHYFLTYKDMPGIGAESGVEIPQIYGADEARKVILASMDDYKAHLERLLFG